jgi:hypothetical protein
MSQSISAATDVGEFIIDLDGGMFDRKLSIALSQVAAAAVDNDKAGEVTVKFSFTKIPGTKQVQCKHQLKFLRPTADGKASEEESRSTPLHVGRFGRLSLAPENQLEIINRAGQPVVAGQ